MILHLIKCEMCENTHRFEPLLGPAYSQLPESWITLIIGNPQVKDGLSYCSQSCLVKSFGVQQPPTQIEAPASKMRRFLLVDGETADEFEGIKWGNGCVSLDPCQSIYSTWFYTSWEAFKQAHEGCGVTWIDQEPAITEDREPLTKEQQEAARQLRERILHGMITETELFYKHHPELRIHWQYTVDALLRVEVSDAAK